MKTLNRILWPFRYRRAVKQAKELAAADGRVYYVLMVAGRPKVIAKRYAKKLVATKQLGRKTTIQDIEKRALFISF